MMSVMCVMFYSCVVSFITIILEITKDVFSLCPGEDEPYEVADRPEAKGGSEHLRNVDHLQRSGHGVSRSSF